MAKRLWDLLGANFCCSQSAMTSAWVLILGIEIQIGSGERLVKRNWGETSGGRMNPNTEPKSAPSAPFMPLSESFRKVGGPLFWALSQYMNESHPLLCNKVPPPAFRNNFLLPPNPHKNLNPGQKFLLLWYVLNVAGGPISSFSLALSAINPVSCMPAASRVEFCHLSQKWIIRLFPYSLFSMSLLLLCTHRVR